MTDDSSSRTYLIAALTAGVAIRVLLAMRNIEPLDDLFVPDDTYYTLGIARELAMGHGPSADGATLTNGFQPLQAFLLVPVFLLGASADAALRAAIVVSAIADVGALFALAGLARRAAGRTAGAVVAAAWGVSPLALANALNGLETSLSVCLVAAAMLLWDGERERPAAWRRVVLGVVLGLAVLARIDTVIAALLFGLVCLRERRWELALTAAACALVTVGGWWAYEVSHFGTVIPSSGAAVREIAGVHRSMYLDARRQIAWATGTLIGAPFWTWSALRLYLFESLAATLVALAAWGACLVAGTRSVRAALRGRAAALPVLVLFGWGVAVALLYVAYVPAVWFFSRYLLPSAAGLAVWCGILLARATSNGGPARRRVALFAAAVLPLVALAAGMPTFVSTPGATVDRGLDGAKGYRRAAREVLAQLPRGAVVGSLQSGALGYFGRYDVRVVNLDGVVDEDAAAAFASGRLAELAEQRGVTHLVDWPFNVSVFERRGGSALARMKRERVGGASPQGDDTMEIWAVRWEPRDAPR
jgi:hypothetical protein